MECVPKFEVGLFGLILAIGYLFGVLLWPRISDLYGRKKVFYLGLGGYVLIVALIIFITNRKLYYCMIFLIGLGSSAWSDVGYVYLNELVPSKSNALVSSVGLFFVSESVVMASVYFWFISKNW